MNKTMRVLSLFSGIGGFDLACEWAGMEIVGQVEIDGYCCKVLDKHWPNMKRLNDIFEVRGDEFGTVDLIVAGVPCQPASCAGKRRGTEDDRWLWGEALRVVKIAKPRWCVFENPTGILSLQGGVPFEDILVALETEGYEVQPFIIPACAVNAPHRRERVFIVAHSTITQRQSGAEVEGVLRAVLADQREHDNADGPGAAQSGDVADTAVIRREGFYQVPRGNGEEQEKRRLPESSGGSIGPAQPRLGRVPHGFSAGMDGHSDAVRWSSGPGAQQHEWEPPRIAKGVPNRTQRLKALGNAVVPAQVYPILQAIADIEARQDGA